MNELDFIDALCDKSTKRDTAAREFLTRVKTAGSSQAVTQFVRQHAQEIGSALVGAGLATGAQYFANKEGKGGKPSVQQVAARSLEEKQKGVEQKAKREGRELSFREGMQSATAPSASRASDVLAKHPVKGALLAAPAGAAAGLFILKQLKNLKG